MDHTARRIEALLFISPRPLGRDELAAACEVDDAGLDTALAAVADALAEGRHGFTVVEVAGGWTLRVARDCEAAVERYSGTRRPDDLSPALLETLAVVAYLQPTTRAEVALVRGVSSEWALSGLVERGLVEEAGRADTPGAPILYATTRRFLQLFGLASTAELPPLAEFSLSAAESEELRARLLANAERRRS
jgi:segregation and condensation protein B